MKKTLLSLLCAGLASFAIHADEVVFVADGATYTGSSPSVKIANNTSGNIIGENYTATDVCTLSWEKKNSNYSQVNSSQVRWYATDILTIAPVTDITIEKVVVATTAAKYTVKDDAATISAQTGEIATATTPSCSITWTGSSSTALALTATAQVRFTTITITYSANEGGGGDTPTPPVETGDGTTDNPYTVTDVLAKTGLTTSPGSDVKAEWVKGYIVGFVDGNSASATTATFSAENAKASNIIIAQTPDETDWQKCASVQLPSGTHRTKLNLADNPENLGKEVKICGQISLYLGLNGVRNLTDSWIEGQAEETVVNVDNIAAWFSNAKGADDTKTFKITGDVIVTYQVNDQNLYVQDATGSMFIYGKLTGKTYEPGTVLTGIEGKYDAYNNMPEFIPTANSFTDGTPGTAPQPVDASAADLTADDAAKFVKLTGVTVICTDESKGYYSLSQGETTLQIYNQGNQTIYAGENIDITGIVNISKTAIRIIPTEQVGTKPVETVTEVENIAAWLEQKSTTDDITITGNVTVVYQNGQNLFVQDETGSLLVRGELDKTYTAGDVLAGIKGKLSYYKEMPQFIPVAETFGEATAGTAPTPKTVTLAEITDQMLAAYVKIEGVDVAAVEGKDRNFTMTQGEATMPLYNSFNYSVTVTPGEGLTVVGVVYTFDGTIQVYPIENVGEAPQPEDPEVTEAPTEFLTISAAQALGDEAVTGQWVKGYIVGYADLSVEPYLVNETTAMFTAENAGNTNLLIAAEPEVTDYHDCLSIQLPKGLVRDRLNLQDNAGNLGKGIYLFGDVQNYAGIKGLKNTSKYCWFTETPDPDSINELNAADADAPVRYFDLRGCEVTGTPAAGVYIRVQGTTVSKVLVK